MNGRSYSSEPPNDDVGWQRIHRTVSEWEDKRETLTSIVTVIEAAATVRRALPYVVILGAGIAAIYNWSDLLKMVGG